MARPNERAVRTAVAIGIIASVLAILAGCFGPWFASTPAAKLYVGEPMVSAGQGQLLISVADMSNGGVAGVHVALGGLLYDQEKLANLVVEGLNGFAVLIQQFVDGQGGFILADTSGVPSGPILRLTFEAHGNVRYGDVQLLADYITLVDDALLLVEAWETPAYYAH